jgi:uncharacterized protein YbcV (DUF1398 family)
MTPLNDTTITGLDLRTIRECSSASFEANMPFPEVVRRLQQARVERYHTDLVLRAKTYYGQAGQSHIERFPEFTVAPPAERFSESQVKAALHAIQQRQIGYREFLSLIMTAGAVSYCVFINGRKAIYFGRHGDFHVERFPPAE